MNKIVERIETQRKKLGLTQKEVCQKCNIVDTTYSSWKNRNRIPSIEEASRIAETLGVTLEWLATGLEKIKPGTVLSKDEQQLLDYYHAANQDGQSRIREQAKLLSREHPSNLKNSNEKCS